MSCKNVKIKSQVVGNDQSAIIVKNRYMKCVYSYIIIIIIIISVYSLITTDYAFVNICFM